MDLLPLESDIVYSGFLAPGVQDVKQQQLHQVYRAAGFKADESQFFQWSCTGLPIDFNENKSKVRLQISFQF